MCWAIMISSNLETRERLVADPGAELTVHRLDPSPTPGRSFAVITERGGCGCELYCLMHEILDSALSWEHELDQRRKRYRSKGWSEAKIKRAISTANQDHNRTQAKRGSFAGVRIDAGTLIRRAVELDPTAELVVHMAGGDNRDDLPMFDILEPTELRVGPDDEWCAAVAPDIRYRLRVGR